MTSGIVNKYCVSGLLKVCIGVCECAFVCVNICMCIYACVSVGVRIHIYLCMCVCVWNFYTHFLMAVSSLLILMNTATATIPPMAAVSRTPPTKPPMAVPTPILEHAWPVW